MGKALEKARKALEREGEALERAGKALERAGKTLERMRKTVGRARKEAENGEDSGKSERGMKKGGHHKKATTPKKPNSVYGFLSTLPLR
jgi:hypothetical protein